MNIAFETSDIQFTAFLLTQGITLLEVIKSDAYHYSFVLSDPDGCQQLKRAFLNNAQAPAQELFAKREMLISEIKNKQVDHRGQKS